MRLIGFVSTAILSLTLAAAAPAYAQQEQHEQEEQKARSAQEENKAHPESGKQEEKKAEHDKNARPEEKNAQHHTPEARPEKQEHRAGGGRIPDERFRANFGREHRFHVSSADYRRDRRFQYGGYWFGFVDPWPTNWLYTQDVYVVDINGVYYLCNPTYPGVNIALSVTL